MKKLLKRALTLSLCACMMVGMATSASANNIQLRSLVNGSIVSPAPKINISHRLNILTTQIVKNKTNVTTWNGNVDAFQLFTLKNNSNGTYTFACSVAGYNNFVVERYYGTDNMNNCDMYDSGSSYILADDYQFSIYTYPQNGTIYQQIRTRDNQYAMSAEKIITVAGSNIYDVRWVSPNSNSSKQLWLI